MFLKIY